MCQFAHHVASHVGQLVLLRKSALDKQQDNIVLPLQPFLLLVWTFYLFICVLVLCAALIRLKTSIFLGKSEPEKP